MLKAAEIYDREYGIFEISRLEAVICGSDDAVLNYREDRLYSDDDFVVRLNNDGRNWVGVKMGLLFIQFCPGGKGSAAFRVHTIDKHQRELRFLLDDSIGRYSSVKFSDLIPIDLGSFYTMMTMVPDRFKSWTRQIANVAVRQEVSAQMDQILAETKLKADAVREQLTAMAMGNAPVMDFASILGDYHAALASMRAQISELYFRFNPDFGLNVGLARGPIELHPVGTRDVIQFGQNPGLKPRNEQELAAKIVAVYQNELGIESRQITDILREYINESHTDVNTLDADFIARLLEILVDKRRYALRSIFPTDDNGQMLQEAVQGLMASPQEIVEETDRAIQEDVLRQVISQLQNKEIQLIRQSPGFFRVRQAVLEKTAAIHTAVEQLQAINSGTENTAQKREQAKEVINSLIENPKFTQHTNWLMRLLSWIVQPPVSLIMARQLSLSLDSDNTRGALLHH